MNKAQLEELYTEQFIRIKELEAENEALQNTVDYIWQEIYEADEPVLSVASVEKLRRIALLAGEQDETE